jgi:hypothetical protein
MCKLLSVLSRFLTFGLFYSVLAKLRHFNQILDTRMHPVSQTQPELVFKNPPPLAGELALLDVSEFDTLYFLGST